MTDVVEETKAIESNAVKPKKKKKGYFDNELFITLITERNKLRIYAKQIEFTGSKFKESRLIEEDDEKILDITFGLLHDFDVEPEFDIDDIHYNKETVMKRYDRVNNEIGKLYVKVADGMMKRPNFINYPPDQKIDMISDALFYMTRAGERYDVNKANPFAYLSQITFNSFLLSIKNMKKRIATVVCVDHLENFDRMDDE
jgi:hypothetical protein